MRKVFLVLLMSLFIGGELGSAHSTRTESSNDELASTHVEFAIILKAHQDTVGHLTLRDYIEFNDCYHPVNIERRRLERLAEIEKREKQISEFLQELAWKESRCNWKVVNRFGYMGKYQIGKAALKGFSLYPAINSRDFARNPHIFPEELQDSLVVEIMHKNRRYLDEFMMEYRNDTFAGFKINDPAVLGAAHLVGMGNMKKFFESGGSYMPKDGNGVTAGDYMEHFVKFDFVL